MHKQLLGLAVGFALSTSALAATETVITTTIYEDGQQQVEVQKAPRELPEAVMSFAEADANGNGCVDRKEAYDAGILSANFARFARGNCLTESSYTQAITAPSYSD